MGGLCKCLAIPEGHAKVWFHKNNREDYQPCLRDACSSPTPPALPQPPVRLRAPRPRGDAPLPSDVNIVPPGPSVPKELAAYSGKWAGNWGNGGDTILVVEEIIPPSSAVIIYSWGKSYYTKKSGWTRQHADFADGELTARFSNGALVQYRLRPDGTLAGSYSNGSNWGPYSLTARLRRQM